MRIICKEKDFYDFVGFASGHGIEDITFDRRNMWVIKPGTKYEDNDTVGCFVNAILTERRHVKDNDIGLWLGNTLYIFRLTEVANRFEKAPNTTSIEPLSSKFQWKAELIASRKCYDVKHAFPVEFVKIDTGVVDNRKWCWNSLKQLHLVKRMKEDLTYLNKEYKEGNVANWEIKNYFDGWDKIPILKNTWVPSFVSPEEAYYSIEEWLIAQHNDVTQESKDLTDVDKAVNHGFDKKSSFRNVK